MSIEENIRKYRKLKRMSQAELGELVGLAPSAISMYEGGQREPPVSSLRRIAEALDVPLAILLGKDSDGGYYIDPTTADTAQEMFENPDLRMLFDAARDSRPEDLQMAADLLRRLKATNPE